MQTSLKELEHRIINTSITIIVDENVFWSACTSSLTAYCFSYTLYSLGTHSANRGFFYNGR